MDIRYSIEDDGIAVEFDYNRELVDKIRTITGHSFNTDAQKWIIPFYSIDDLNMKFMVPQSITDMADDKLISRRQGLSEVKYKYPLRDFQKDAVLFMLEKQKSFLCADLGTGKTFMSIAYGEALYDGKLIEHIIVISPATLKRHWLNEIEKFTHDSTTIIITGNKIKRREQWKVATDYKYIIMNYDTLRSEEDYIKLINILKKPCLIILDEATKIKNFNAKMSMQVKKLKAPYKTLLSGRPLENRPEELFSMNQFLDNNIFGTWNQFDKKFIVRNSWGSPSYYVRLNELHEKVNKIMYRCKREEVLDELPDKVIHDYYIELSSQEVRDYNVIVNPILELLDSGRSFEEVKRNNINQILSAMQLTKMYCDHPDLLRESKSIMAKIVKVKSKKASKFNELMRIMGDIGDAKIIIFTQYAKMAIKLNETITKKFETTCVTGNDNEKMREIKLNEFKNKTQIMICTDVFGYGVNLQHASILINYDLPWNPAVLEQRIARIHRMGQKNTVNIINLIVEDEDKIERRIRDVLNRKTDLYNIIIEGKQVN